MSVTHNRVDHVVWLVKPENIDGYKDHLARLFDVEFDVSEDPSLLGEGSKLYVAWSAGLELVSPGRGTEIGEQLFARLEERGEGPFSVVFGVPDIDAAAEKAQANGFTVHPQLLGDPPTRRAWLDGWTDKLDDIQERFIEGEFLGMNLLFGQVEYRSS